MASVSGGGSQGRTFLMNLANKHQVTLAGMASSGRADFTNEQLAQWYIARGFVPDGTFFAEEQGLPDLPKVKYIPAKLNR